MGGATDTAGAAGDILEGDIYKRQTSINRISRSI